MDSRLHLVDHPLALHCLARLRDRQTGSTNFRDLTRKLTSIIALEATRDLATIERFVETPLESAEVQLLRESLVVIPILRAGLGMLEPIVQLFPELAVGYVGLERDEDTALARLYYRNLPSITGKTVLVIDPMLATGGTACHALEDVYSHQPSRVKLLCVVAAPEGTKQVLDRFPEIEIFTAALDRELNAQKFILPGLGDFGDRLFGTD